MVVISNVDGEGVMSGQMMEAKRALENRSLTVQWIDRNWLDLKQEKKSRTTRNQMFMLLLDKVFPKLSW